AILAGTALLILAAIYQLYHVIARYRLRKVRFDFTVCLEGVAEHTPIALYDKKGKKALRRNGKAYQKQTDQTGQVTFTDLPGDCYRLKLGKSWLVQFGLKKKKRPSKIWKINKKKVMLKEERILEVK
ncbi:class C sortase, partial [Lactococcus lactis]